MKTAGKHPPAENIQSAGKPLLSEDHLPYVQDWGQGAQVFEDFITRRGVNIDEGNRQPSRPAAPHLPFSDVDALFAQQGAHFPNYARDVTIGEDQGRPGGEGIKPVVVQEDDSGLLMQEQGAADQAGFLS